MDVRTPLFQNIACVLIGVLFLNPLVATAAQLTVDAKLAGNTRVDQAGNGVPIVNIATPNGNGLSHNRFSEYNVGQQGLILNNATDKLQSTQLGGLIVGNPNLNGQAAGLILNEVTGANTSQLKGYTEVAGKSAAVIVANPHGITCDGCGFINTPRVTLSTGKPIVENGRLDRFDVDGGQISIQGAGLNASNIEQFDLITRSAKINAELHANKLNVITGRNLVKAGDLAVTAKVADGSAKPLLAIDSSALGGMYAGAIRLVGTEAGVGVKLAGDMATSAGDIRIDANGQLSLGQTAASQNLKIQARGVNLTGKTYAAGNVDIRANSELANRKSLAAAGSIALQGGQLINQGVIEAGVNPDNSRNLSGDVKLSGDSLRNSGSVLASRELSAVLDGQLDNRGGTLSGKTNTRLSAASLANASDGRVLSQGGLAIAVGELDNRDGLIASAKDLSVRAGGDLHNQGGEISSQTAVALEGRKLNNQGGLIAAASHLQVSAAELDNSARGTLSSQGALTATLTGKLDNHDEGALISQGTLSVQAQALDNRQGGLLSSKGNLTVSDAALHNQGGAIVAEKLLDIHGKSLDNRGGLVSGKAGLRVDVDSVLDNRGQGALISDGKLTVEAAELRNGDRGQVAAKGDLAVSVGSLSQQGAAGIQAGELLSQGKLTLVAGSIDNRQGGLIAASQGLDIRASELLRNGGGEISTQAKANIRVQAAAGQPAAQLDNSGAGIILGDQGLSLTVQRLLNHTKGVLSGRDSLVLIGSSLDNSAGGILSSQQVLSVQLSGALQNQAQGALISGGSLTVDAGALNNGAGGLLSSAGKLEVAGGSLDNRGGKLLSDGQLSLASAGLDNSNGGVISARQALNIATGQLDNQHGGVINGAAGLTVTAGQLNNHNQGLIAAKGAAHISASGLDQHLGGELLSESALSLDLQGGALNNSGQGLIATPGALLLNNLGVVDNSAGGEISSSQSFLLKASQLNNSAGRVISGQDLQLQITQALLNNLKGVLSAAKLTVAAASLDNSAAGVLASKGDIQVSLTGKLDNHDQGTLSAAQALTITSASLDNSDDGLLASGGALLLNTGAANNQDGSILSQATLDASTAALDNRGGVLSSQQALTLNADAIDNRDNGLITSAGKLTLTAASLDSSRHLGSSGGEVSAKQDLQLWVSQLIQRQGRLIGEAGVRIDFQGGDLDNRGGLLSATGPLTLLNLGKLDNRDAGEISSSQSYSLNANAIDNGEQGRVLSAGSLSLDVGSGQLRNANGGLISGWQGLTVKAGNLDNSALGTLSSRDGALTVELSGSERVLNNSGAGALVSKGKLAIDAGSLNNSNKGILSSEGDLELSLSGALNNSAGGLIDSQGALSASTGAINNHSGQIGSQNAASLTASSLDNRAGQLSSNAALNLTLSGNLINTQQAKLASAGPLVLKAAAIDNQGGSLISQNLLSLTGSSLNNAGGGTLAARNGLSLLLSGALNNSADGLIHSQLGAVDIRAHSLNNNDGRLSSQQDLSLNLNAKLDNQGGHIQSLAGNLDLQNSSAVDNSAGVLSSLAGWLKLVTVGLFDNDAGTLQAQSVAIDAKGVDNRGGHISALSGGTAIDIGSATFNNQGGGLYAQQLLDLVAGNFNNQGAAPGQGGKVAAGQIDFGLSGALNNRYGILESASTLRLAAASLDNQYGSLRALGSSGTTLISGGLLDNRNGLIETANTTLQLNVSGLQNGGGIIRHVGTGTFGLSAANVMAAGGSLSSNGLLGITATSWVNSSVLQAGQLVLNIGTFTQTASGQLLAGQSFTGSGTNWVNHGLLASDGSFSLNLSGAYSGNGQLTSLGNLSLSAGSIDLSSSARISGGGLTRVTSNGLLSNHGRLTSADDLIVSASTLNNHATLGSAENLRINAPTLLNENGLIFSGGDMTLRVNNFTNRYADVYSLGALSIAKNDQLAQAGAVENISATLESGGGMRINAQRLDNRTDVYSLGRELISGYIAVRCYDCSGDNYNVDYIAKEFYQSSVLDDSPSAFITAGGNFNFTGGDLFNRQSSISAVGNITVQAANFSNIGAIGGSIERTRIYSTGGVTDGTVKRFVSGYVTPYNQRNNPDFPNIYYGDSQGNIRLAIAEAGSYYIPDGRDSYWVEEVRLFDSVTGARVYLPHGYGSDNLPASQYDPNNLLQLPTELAARYALVSDVEVASDGGAVRSAVVQAGGNVSIQATQSLENSVIRQDYLSVGGSSRVGNTAAQGTGKTTVFQLNAQLPANLQQQQVNPLTLPGFSLPQGEHGLFRLSGQGGASGTASAVQGSAGVITSSGRSVTVGAGQAALGPATVFASAWHLPAGQGVDTPQTGAGTSPAALQIAGVQGVPRNTLPSVSHKYLIETNPELTNLKQFLGSDYMLGNLGYTPDNTQKRLGDGLYEQRLIREAVVARTGQRFLAGLTSDEAMFRYLMDNAIASKQALNLSLGVTLSAAQVAALTHDIVWLEEYEVMGEKVLVPVLYLAQAKDRLGPNGALIQGQDVSLISGGSLLNQGTLRASNNLSAVAAGSISNQGLIEAGNRLDLLASDSIRNAQGGIIAGRDVSLTALTGDVINERSVTRHEVEFGNRHNIQDFADSAARIEAANSLSISAGRDVANLGGVFDSRGDLVISAGRDVTIASVEERSLQARGSRYLDEQVRQLGAQVSAGRDIEISAGRDLTAIASQIEARRDIALVAGGDVLLASAANEDHFLSKSKKVTRQTDRVEQQATEISAGGDVYIGADGNLALVASKVAAGGEAYLVAGEQLALLSAEDYDYSLYQKKKKGSFGSKSFRRDESTRVTNVGSEVTSGGDLTLVSGEDQTYQAAKLESGGDLSLISGGAIIFEGVKDLEQESHEKSKNSWAWTSAKGKGNTDETLVQSQLIAQGEVVIKAVDGLKIDIKQVNQQSVSQTIDAMVQADPQLAWLKEMEQRGDVDWRQVKEVHESFKYSHSGLGGAAMIIIAIIVTYLTAGAASGLVAGAAGAGGASTAAGAAWATTVTTAAGTTAAGWANVAATAVLTSAASNAAISTINNRGNLGIVLKDVTSSDNLKGYATSAITAGVTAGVLDSAFGVTGDNVNKVTKGFDLSKTSDLAKFGTYLGAQGAVQAVAQTAAQGGSLGDNLQNALTGQVQHLLQAGVFNFVGDFADGKWVEGVDWADGSPEKIALHAVVGGLLSEATGGDFKTGALTAGANELLIEQLSGVIKGDKGLELVVSQVIGVAAATATGGDPAKAAELAKNATAYNRQLHENEKQRIKELAQGDSQKEARLTAAACALVKCYAEYPQDSAAYNSLKAMADLGSSDAMAVERQQLQAQQGLFNYSIQGLLSDKNIDAAKQFNNTHQVTTRTVGAGQAVLGGVGVAGTVITAPASCATGLGCVASAAVGTLSVDAALAGTKQALSGNPESTYLNEALQSLGLSPEAAMYAELALGLGAAAKAGGVVNATTASQASKNAAAKLSYEDISKFGAKGLNVTPEVLQTPQAKALVAEYQAAGLAHDKAIGYAGSVLQTGNSLPIVRSVAPNEELIKVVPKNLVGNDGVGPTSPFFMTRAEYNTLNKLSSTEIGQRLGLPAEQSIRGSQLGFEAYSITPKPGAVPKVFVSTVAPVEQGAYKAVGGAQQTIVPNRSLWTEPKSIGPTGRL